MRIAVPLAHISLARGQTPNDCTWQEDLLERLNMKATCSLLVVYQDGQARTRAMAFLDALAQRFGDRCHFDASWWSFDQLDDMSSLSNACGADLVVFAPSPGIELPRPVRQWTETLLASRGNREGALVNLTDFPFQVGTPISVKTATYLREVAHRGGLDYLTQVPEDILGFIPDSAEWCSNRARQVTLVLDEILHQPAQTHRF